MEFALLFRPTRALGADELSRRNEAARDWVLARRTASAVELARAHPGLAFGTEIEVRPVKAVAVPPR